MITWDFYSKRRKISLSKFLVDVNSYEDAVAYFRSREISPPKNLKDLYENLESGSVSKSAASTSKADKVIETPQVKKQSSTRKTQASTRKKAAAKKPTSRRKAAPKKKEEPVQEASQEQTVETKDEKKQYFRKIIKPEKK